MLNRYELATSLLNRWLERIGPEGKASLQQLGAGKSIRIHSPADALDLLIEVGDSALSVHPGPSAPGAASDGEGRAASLDIEFSLAILAAPALGLGPDRWRECGLLRVHGDINFAERILKISQSHPTDLGAISEGLIGQTGTLALERTLSFIREVFSQAVENLRQDAIDYLHYDSGILADAATLEALAKECGQLEADIAALESRLGNKES